VVHVGLIGYGYWGPNLLRNFAELPGSQVIGVSDVRPERLELVRARYPAVRTSTNWLDLIGDPSIDAIAVATPVSTHFDLAMKALQAGKHVLVEKPLTANSGEAIRLIEEAERRKLVLMVDHTFVYTGAVRKIRELVAEGKVGEVYYYDSVRVNLGLFQHEVDVMWDLAVHDLAIMIHVLACEPSAIAATGMKHFQGGKENIAYITAFFEGSMIAHINVNWLAPVKVRRTMIGGSRQMIVYDDLEITEKVKVYDRGVTFNPADTERVYQELVGYRMGDMWAPKLDITEALRIEGQHFIDSIETGRRPITDGETGLRVVRILEAATESMKARGKLVELEGRRTHA
jgi:predicted dehydrogenase